MVKFQIFWTLFWLLVPLNVLVRFISMTVNENRRLPVIPWAATLYKWRWQIRLTSSLLFILWIIFWVWSD